MISFRAPLFAKNAAAVLKHLVVITQRDRTVAVKTLSAIAFLVLALTANACASRNEAGGGVLFGPKHVFEISAPKGWIFDNESGVSQDLHAVIYPVGGSWNDSPIVLYTNVLDRPAAEAMATDLAQYRKDSPQVKFEDRPAILTADGRRALVREFTGDRYGNHELIAYIDTPGVVCSIIMTARKGADVTKGRAAFAFVVRSFRFITDDEAAWKTHVKAGGDPRKAP